MTIKDWLGSAVVLLKQAGIGTARLDCLVLLEDITSKDRGWLLAHPEHKLETKNLELLDKQLSRRQYHEPLAYIRGKTEFYGREFLVTTDTLEPRPETETMIELFKELSIKPPAIVIDVGTGSGAIAITIKLERPETKVFATEINHKALKVAIANAKKLDADIHFYEGNLLEPVSKLKIDIIMANLPYVPDNHTINQAAMREPATAIFGGPDGLDLYRRLFGQLTKLRPRYVLTESLPPQHKALNSIARNSGYKLIKTDDFIQLFRIQD